MLFTLTLLLFVIIFSFVLFRNYLSKKSELEDKKLALGQELSKLEEEDKELTIKISNFEKKIAELFTFYETTRLVSSLFEKEKLVHTFISEISSLDSVNRVSLSRLEGPNCHKFEINPKDGFLYIDTKSFSILQVIPIFVKLLSVCFERLKLYDRLQELSIHDYLTDAYNRRYFELRMDEEFLRAKNLKHKLSFLMLDIDNFKKINDTYGHLVGDAVLKKCTFLIAESIRQIDFVGRLGGEEFGVLLLDTDKAGAIMVSERICSKVSQEKIKVFDESLSVTVSIGISTYPTNTIYMDLLAEIADKALLRAKASGKDRVCWF